MKKRVLFSVVTAVLLLANSITAFADGDQIEKDFAVEKPVADKPSPYEDAMLTPYRFNNYIPVTQKRPDFYAEATAPGRKNPVWAAGTHSYGESYKVIEEWDTTNKFFEYDAQGNLVSMNEFLSDGSLFRTQQYTYDTQGNLLSDIAPYNTIRYTYDTQGRLLSEINSADTDIVYGKKYTYDAMGNVLTYTYTETYANNKDTYTRDAQGNVLTHTFGTNSGNTKEQHTLTHDAQGNLLTDHMITSSNPEAWEESQYTYDAQGNRLTCDVTLYAGSGNFLTFQYAYDAMGNVLTHTHESMPQSDRLYTYPFSSIERYTYDAQGNLLTYTYDSERSYRKLESKSKQYTYDAQGNLLTYTYTNIDHTGTAYHEPGYIEIEKRQYFYE